MAARINLKHDAETREKIQTSQLINRLQDNANGRLAKEMTASQVKSAEILLRKALPDLSSVTFDGTLLVNPIADLLKEIDGRSRGIPEGD